MRNTTDFCLGIYAQLYEPALEWQRGAPRQHSQTRWAAVGLYSVGRIGAPIQTGTGGLSNCGGITMELATDGPGMTINEPPDTLGTTLHLPPYLYPSQRMALAEQLHDLWPSFGAESGDSFV